MEKIIVLDLKGLVESYSIYEGLASLLEKLDPEKGKALTEDIFKTKVLAYYAYCLKAGFSKAEAIQETRKFAWLLKNKDRIEFIAEELTVYGEVPEDIFEPLPPRENEKEENK